MKYVIDANHFGDIVEQLENHFDERVDKFGGGLQSVDWKSPEAQYTRFQQLLKLIEQEAKIPARFSLNDYGCGYGELVNLLNARELDFDYFGYDVSPQMIRHAEEAYKDFDNCHFSTRRDELPLADYTVASGIFNLKFDNSDERWLNYILQTITELSESSRLGFAFNALTTYSDVNRRRADLYYADPLFLFDYCKRNISRRVSLLHDYPEYDFTILVRKDR